jgi:type II secretory pathway pseudopilin PulG
VIAIAILGIGLGVILPGIGLSLRLRQEAAAEARLAVAAEQLLGNLVLREKAPESAEDGETDGCRWRLEPWETPRAGSAAAATHGAELATVRLTITSPEGKSWELTTLLPRGAPESAP